MEESDSESEHLVLTRRRRGRDGSGGGGGGDVVGGGGGAGVGKKINGLVVAEKSEEDVVLKSRAVDKSDLPPAVYSRKKPKVEDFDRGSGGGGGSRKGVGRKVKNEDRRGAAVNGKRFREKFDSSDFLSESGDEKLISNSIDDKKLSKLKGSHRRSPADGVGSASFERKGMKAQNGEVGIRVQGKGGVLKLIPNKRMKLDVYEQSRGMKEAEEGRGVLLSDSRRNALVSMGKKMGDRPLQTSPVKFVNRMGRKRDYESLDDDSSSSGTESGSISDDHRKVVERRKKNSNGPASIHGKGKKDPSAGFHLDEKGKNSFLKGGLKGKQKNPVATKNNSSSRIAKLDKKIKPAKVDSDELYSSHESGGADLVTRKRNSLSEVTSVGRSKKEMNINRRTEKQILRDQIKNMLIDAGWTIELRPRSGRNCLDSVYISPLKSAFWSITNAYRALEKQFDSRGNQLDGSDNHKSNSFSRIPADVLSIITRRTNSKKAKEQRAKKKSELGEGRKNVKKIKSESVNSVKQNSSAKRKWKSKDKVLGNIKHGRLESVSLSDESNDSFQDKSANISSKKAVKTIKAPKAFADSEVQGKQNAPKKRYALLARSSNKEGNSDANESSRYSGKLTVLSWLIDSGTVPENDKVQYMNKRRTKALLDGWITRDGIHCSCCSKILSVSKFEIHAGSKLRQPFQNIYLESGVPLLQCQVEAWNLQKDSDREVFHCVETSGDDPNDDACVICGDGGNLICCDGCPSTFHQGCLNVKVLPQGDWHCPNCSCKFCGIKDPKDDTLYTCSQCERKCHQKCSGETSVSPNHAFCGKSCKKLFENLQKLIGTKKDLEGGYSCSLLRRVANDSEGLSRGQSQMIEWNSKLAVALALMDECFLPIVDRRSGVNMIHNVVYNCGSNFSRLNYSGFYTVILERGDEMISAASIRIHGIGLAEMPFIGTRHIYRRQGMCRRLLNAIESVLFSLDIEKLVIPAISELMHTWTDVFGFKPIDDSDKQELKSMSLIVFPSTDMLHKPLLKSTRVDTGRPDGPDDRNCSDMNTESLSVKLAAHALKDDVVELDVDSDKLGLNADGVSLDSNSHCDIRVELNDPSASFSAALESSAAEDCVVDCEVDGEKVACTADESCQDGVTRSKDPSLSIHILPGSDVVDDSVSPARSTTIGTVPHPAVEVDCQTSADTLPHPVNSAVEVDCQTSADTVPHPVNSAIDVDCQTSAENTVSFER